MTVYTQSPQNYNNVFKAQSADGVTDPIMTGSFRNIVVSLKGYGGANFTVKVKGSDEPTYNLPTTYTYLETKNEESATFYSGNSGVIFTSNQDIKVEVNTNNVNWIQLELSGYTGGSLDATVVLSD
mgnify:FL=1